MWNCACFLEKWPKTLFESKTHLFHESNRGNRAGLEYSTDGKRHEQHWSEWSSIMWIWIIFPLNLKSLWSWSVQAGLWVGPRLTFWKCCYVLNIKATHSFIHFPSSLFLSIFLLFLLDSSKMTLKTNIRGLCGMAASNSCGIHSGRKGWSHDPAGHWPRFRHCSTSAIFSLTLAQWFTATTTSLGCTARIMQNWVE